LAEGDAKSQLGPGRRYSHEWDSLRGSVATLATPFAIGSDVMR
jgi:hypothetical protein